MVDQAEIHRKSMSSAAEERKEAVNQIGINFAELPDKEQAWADLHQLTQDADSKVRSDAASVIGSVFPLVPDKNQAWSDLIGLTNYPPDAAAYRASEALEYVFPYVPDKRKAWTHLINGADFFDGDRDSSYIQGNFAKAIFKAVPYVSDKEQVLADLIRLKHDEENEMPYPPDGTLCLAFSQLPNKNQAWSILLREVEWGAVALKTVFTLVPDKEQAWNDLHRLAKNESSYVRLSVADALGYAFLHIPDKSQAWADLIQLAQDKDRNVRVSANHSLGRASIFRANEAESEEEFRKELETALCFFEKASTEATYINPAKFCLPFYRSFYALTFKKQEAKAEVQRYLTEAKSASGGSKNKEQLLEAIENLADALQEVQDLRETDFDIMKRDLNVYRRYCDQAADLLETTEEKAPGATKLIRKGLPIFNQRINELLDGIDKETTILCDAVRGTEAEEFVKPTCKGVRELIKIRNPIELDKRIAGLIPNLRFMVENLPERERNFGYDKIETIDKEEYLEDKLSLLNEIIVFVAPHISLSKDLERLENKLDDIMISLEPGIREELTVTVGAKVFGTGIEKKINIPLQEIKYSDLKKDLESIKGKSLAKLASLPPKLAEKVKDHIIRNKKDDIL